MPAFIKILVLSSIACLAMGQLPYLGFIMAIMWGLSLVMGGYYLEKPRLILIFLLNIMLLYGTTGSSTLFYYLLIIGIPSLIMAWLLSMGRAFYDLQKWGTLSAVVGVSIFLVFAYYAINDKQIEQIETQVEQYVEESIELSVNSRIFDIYEENGISQEELKQGMMAAARSAAYHLPAYYYLKAILSIFLILYLTTYFSRKRGLQILSKKAYIYEIMPWQFTWLVIAGLALWLLGRDQISWLYYTGSNILVLSAPVSIYYGIADISYRIKKLQGKRRKWMIGIFIVLIVLFTLSALIFIALLGLFDSLLDYRKVRKKEEEEQ